MGNAVFRCPCLPLISAHQREKFLLSWNRSVLTDRPARAPLPNPKNKKNILIPRQKTHISTQPMRKRDPDVIPRAHHRQ
jgi:hypothetical protein